MSSGLELPSKAREIRDHFIEEGTPIMIGGDLYAYTILGIDYCEQNDDIQIQILYNIKTHKMIDFRRLSED